MCAEWKNAPVDAPPVQWQRMTGTDTDTVADAFQLFLNEQLLAPPPESSWETFTSLPPQALPTMPDPHTPASALPLTTPLPDLQFIPPQTFPTPGPSAPEPTNPTMQFRWANSTRDDYDEDKERLKGKGRQGQKSGAHRGTVTARPGNKSDFDSEERDKMELLSWFKHTSVSNLFNRGSPTVLPSDVQKKWEELIAKTRQDLQLPRDIQSMVRGS